MRYKYFYNKHPEECPMCGTNWLLDTEFSESLHGFQKIGGKLVWCYSENETHLLDTKLCFHCGQPIHYRKWDVDESNCFYIYINAFIGWEGSARPVCISANLLLQEVICTVYDFDNYIDIPLSNDLSSWILDNHEALLHYTSTEQEDIWNDVNVYYFRMITETETNTFGFQSPYADRHPLFDNLVNLLLTVHQQLKTRK